MISMIGVPGCKPKASQITPGEAGGYCIHLTTFGTPQGGIFAGGNPAYLLLPPLSRAQIRIVQSIKDGLLGFPAQIHYDVKAG